MAYETIKYEISAGVATITVDRPVAMNALNPHTASELGSALGAAERDDAVRAIVLTGSGRAFGSGADLRAGFTMNDAGAPDVLTPLRVAYNPLMTKLRSIPKPVIAALNGPAVGISMSLALCCDYVIATESGYFLLAFVGIGLTIDGGISMALASRVGFTRAAELALLGDRLPFSESKGWGLVNEVVPDGEFAAAVANKAERFAAGPLGSYAATKELLNAVSFRDFAARLDHEAELQQRCAASPDFMEGVTAFQQKRKPVFGAPAAAPQAAATA